MYRALSQSHSLHANDFSLQPSFERNSQKSQQKNPLKHLPFSIWQGLYFWMIFDAMLYNCSYVLNILLISCKEMAFLTAPHRNDSLFLSISTYIPSFLKRFNHVFKELQDFNTFATKINPQPLFLPDSY
jgi:hypothetical protein